MLHPTIGFPGSTRIAQRFRFPSVDWARVSLGSMSHLFQEASLCFI